MPITFIENEQLPRHSEDVQDIITKTPSWILRWGITLFFVVLLLIAALSALIRYPDIVKAQLKIDSPNSPKPTVSKISGKLVRLLVTENQMVKKGQALAYIESTASHAKILSLLAILKNLQNQVLNGTPVGNVLFSVTKGAQFGELQSAYQVFFQEYLLYKSSIGSGFDLKKKAYLQKDLLELIKQTQQLKVQKDLQQKDLNLSVDEFEMHKKLAQQKVETPAELRQEESKLLDKKAPLIQTESALISSSNNYSDKEKEILELDNQILEERSKFLQAINSLISQAEDWKSKYVLTASQAGKLSYAGIVQENEVLSPNQEVFYINPGNEQFFGEMTISQNNMGKVKEGQQVLIKLKSYPFEEYGIITGTIIYIADVPYRDSVFISKVNFKLRNVSDIKKPIHLKQGMMADAEIITQNATILHRIYRSMIKVIK
jgi:multidrug efflux pump subunit AcrA (membrane-fusion protein)